MIFPMQPINLVSVLNAYETLDEKTSSKYLNHFDIGGLRKHEISSLSSLVQNLEKCIIKDDNDDISDISILDEYYVGYSIPQIGKEFDLLKFGANNIINIELKRESSEEKVLKQLSKNRYYLSFLNRNLFCFTYILDECKLYQLDIKDNKDNLIEIDFTVLYNILNDIEVEHIPDIDALFNPCNYLVSPFNSTERFITSEYFLTRQQEDIKNDIIAWVDTKDSHFISITGSAGTGKTLLSYHIAKELLESKKRVLILHCGGLNEGQKELNVFHDWDIKVVKNGCNKNFDEFDLIMVDEAQRIYVHQLETIIQKVTQAGKKCIFSYDRKQCLRQGEANSGNIDTIEKITTTIHKLTDTIRTNKEINDFIRQLFSRKQNFRPRTYPNVEINYFSNYNSAKSQLVCLSKQGWKVINYTPGTHSYFYYEKRYNIPTESESAHSVIGQEFDNVVGVIDELFYYDEEGELNEKSHLNGVCMSKYYSQYGMLYQILTRARKKVNLVIINNPEVLTRCLDILGR